MRRGQRPSRHVRRVRTKKGRKAVLVNRHVRRRLRRQHYSHLPSRQLSDDELKKAAQKPYHTLTDAEYAALEEAGVFQYGTLDRPKHFRAFLEPDALREAAIEVSEVLGDLRHAETRRDLTPREQQERAALERANVWLGRQMQAAPRPRLPFFERPPAPAVTPLNPPSKVFGPKARQATAKEATMAEAMEALREGRRRTLNTLEESRQALKTRIGILATERARQQGVQPPPDEPEPELINLVVATPSPKELAVTDPAANFTILSQLISNIDSAYDPARQRAMANSLLHQVKSGGPLRDDDRRQLLARLHRIKENLRAFPPVWRPDVLGLTRAPPPADAPIPVQSAAKDYTRGDWQPVFDEKTGVTEYRIVSPELKRSQHRGRR